MRRLFALLLLPIFLIPIAHAQDNATPLPAQSITTSPAPNLQYVPQKAYIVPLGPDGQVAVAPIQEQNANGEIAGIAGIISAIGAGLWAKMSGKKDNKETNAALLNTKEVNKELARVMYNFQPTQAAALSDAPAIKLENLEKDKQQFAEKVAKQ